MISVAIGDLMRAEFTNLRDRDGKPVLPPGGASIEDWQQQTYLSSGSLIAKGCQSALLLAGHPRPLQDAAHQFGCHVAYAHQVYIHVLSLKGHPHLMPDGPHVNRTRNIILD